MPAFKARQKPQTWEAHRNSIRYGWSVPLHAVNWCFDWMAYFLSRWAVLEVLEYAGTLSVLVAIILYFAESGDRKKQKHYQAWQVINTAQGKGGNGGRIEALQELNTDRVPLVGVDASGAFLQGVRLARADLVRADLSGSDLRTSDFSGANLENSDLNFANFRGAILRGTNLKNANLRDTDLNGANLTNADLSGALLDRADICDADLSGLKWRGIASIAGAKIHGVKNAPAGFVEWALAHQATLQSSH